MHGLTVGCVMVVANGERYLGEQLDSMVAQTRPLDQIVVVDDHSADRSVEIVDRAFSHHDVQMRTMTAPSAPRGASLYSRIARNFVAGIRAIGADIVVLADQDDIWLPTRVEIQAEAFEKDRECALVAGNGELIDDESISMGRSLREVFPIHDDWGSLSHDEQERYVLNHPVVTGAASAIMPARLPGRGRVPRGWLHDRWYSLEAVATEALRLDQQNVIRYRKHSSQVVGVSEADDWTGRLRRRISQPALAAKKLLDLDRLARASENASTSVFSFRHSIPVLLQSGSSERSPVR